MIALVDIPMSWKLAGRLDEAAVDVQGYDRFM